MSQFAKSVLRALGLRRAHVATGRLLVERHALARVSALRKRPEGRALCYHSVGQARFGVNDVSPARFERQIVTALAAGYRFVAPSVFASGQARAMDLAITFDDGASSVLTAAAPIMWAHHVPFGIFVVTDWSEKAQAGAISDVLSWRDIETLVSRGAELGSHSVTHPDFGRIGRDQTIEELTASRRVIEARVGIAPDTFAIPYGLAANWPAFAASAAADAGYTAVFAQAEDTRPRGTAPRSFVTRHDDDVIFRGLLGGAFDRWEEWC